MEINIGDRFRLRHAVDRYPHFIAPAGAVGTIVDTGDPDLVALKLDDVLPGAEEWENEVHWHVGNGDTPARDLIKEDWMTTYPYADMIDSKIKKLVALKLEESHLQWELGESASPSELDYVIYADEILRAKLSNYSGSTQEGREFVADTLSERQSGSDQITEWAEIAEYIIDQLVAE